MNRAVWKSIILLSALWLGPAHSADAPPADLAKLQPFIGRWEFGQEFLAANEWAKDFYAEVIAWGPKKNIVRMHETVHKSDANRLVFEGLAYWHPQRNKLEYVGYNVQERFLFEGEIVALEPDRLVREYRVHYPPGYAHSGYPELKGDVREYRGEYRLVDADTLEVANYIRTGGKWSRWPAPDAKPVIVRRAPS